MITYESAYDRHVLVSRRLAELEQSILALQRRIECLDEMAAAIERFDKELTKLQQRVQIFTED